MTTTISGLPAGTIAKGSEVAPFDQAGVTVHLTVGQVLGALSRIVTAAGDVLVTANDVVIVLNKTVGAATNINLPTAASRAGAPVTVKDLKGDANTNNITFLTAGSETIDGFSSAAAITNGTALIDVNYARKTLYPLASGGWYT